MHVTHDKIIFLKALKNFFSLIIINDLNLLINRTIFVVYIKAIELVYLDLLKLLENS